MPTVNDPSGQWQAVDSKHRAATFATTEPVDAYLNKTSGKVWSIPFEGLSPTGADDYVLYIKNTGDKTFHISDVRVIADTATTLLRMQVVSGTASGGSSISPVSRTVGSPATISGIVESGSDITGLTSDGVQFYISCHTVNVEAHLSSSSRVRVPKGKAVALQVVNATAIITGVISIVEEE